jgi:predicted metal-dependent TIM-barrel fold hydrolase
MELLQEMTLLAESDAKSAKAQISIVAQRDLPMARVDRNYFKQVLLNNFLTAFNRCRREAR